MTNQADKRTVLVIKTYYLELYKPIKCYMKWCFDIKSCILYYADN